MFQTTNQVLYILVVEYWIIPYIMEKKIMFQTTNQHSFVSEMSEIHPTSSDKRENNGLKVQFHR